MRVSHIMLGVSDLDRSLEFYRDKLGFRVQQQLPDFVFLDGGSVTLALSKDIWTHLGKTTGAAQVVLGVNNVKTTYAELRNKGVEFMNEPRDVNGLEWAANFRDPDGHLLSIFGPPGE